MIEEHEFKLALGIFPDEKISWVRVRMDKTSLEDHMIETL